MRSNSRDTEIVLDKLSRNFGINECLDVRAIDGDFVTKNDELHLIPHIVQHIKLLVVVLGRANVVEKIDHPLANESHSPKLDMNSVPENSVSDIPKI